MNDPYFLFTVETLKLPVVGDELLPDVGVRLVYLDASNTFIQLVQPTTSTAITRFLKERGEGLHHICFGLPVVMEATGNTRVMEQTVDLVAAGGRIVIVGLVPAGVGVTFPGLDYTRKEITVLGSRASVNCFPEALELLAGDTITYPNLATEFSL